MQRCSRKLSIILFFFQITHDRLPWDSQLSHLSFLEHLCEVRQVVLFINSCLLMLAVNVLDVLL